MFELINNIAEVDAAWYCFCNCKICNYKCNSALFHKTIRMVFLLDILTNEKLR